MLVVANHPNSFLDAILIGSVFSENVHFLARGDAFRQKKHRFLLKMLKMIPIYRLSEGKENLYLNELAFAESKHILQSGGIVLIFIEGICINSHTLQPFKKGAARIALHSNSAIPLKILPVSITYDSFYQFGKRVRIKSAPPILANTLFPFEEEAKNLSNFNDQIRPILAATIQPPNSILNKKGVLLQSLAEIGKWIHYPLYWCMSKTIQSKTKGTVFYDSVLFGALLLIYPLYLIILHALIYVTTGSYILFISSSLIHLFSTICASKWLNN